MLKSLLFKETSHIYIFKNFFKYLRFSLFNQWHVYGKKAQWTKDTLYIRTNIIFFVRHLLHSLSYSVFFPRGSSFLFLCFSVASVAHPSLRDELNYTLSQPRRGYLNLNRAFRAAWSGCFNDATRRLRSTVINSNMRFLILQWQRKIDSRSFVFAPKVLKSLQQQ